MLLMWTIGILTLWSRAKVTMHERGRQGLMIAGEHKAVIELADAMRKELSTKSIDLKLLSDTEIAKRINDVNGGRVLYSSSLCIQPARRMGFKEWLKREQWWLIATIICIAMTELTWQFVPAILWPLKLWSIGPTCGFVFSMVFGSTTRSRCFFVFLWTLMLFVLALYYGEGTLIGVS
jgi:hypothetical protein